MTHPRRPAGRRRRLALTGLVGVVSALVVLAMPLRPALADPGSGATTAAKPSYTAIEGSGSTWSQVILEEWMADVSSSGIQVTYNGTGSSQGRKDFANGVTDFGISEIPYQGTDPVTGQSDTSSRPYAYLPIVAGGTAFTYHVEVGGQLVRTLRLSGETIAKIFTNKITNWNDPAITQDNNGHALPSLPIHPVVRSDGSGTTAQFTRYLATMYPSIWGPFNGGKAVLTSQFPRQGAQIAQSGSDQVMNTIKGSAGNGTIGYVEYSYPLNAHYPVVKVENKAGYFVEPTQYNVAVALTKAQINKDKSSINYLTQILDGVYRDTDPRAYPLSSYSYMIIPTSRSDTRMTTSKRQTLADFVTYDICAGQSKAGFYGYSPLPLNLVQAGFEQIAKLKKADPGVDLTNHDVASCNNPTFVKGDLSANHLAQIAPMPASCDKVGAGPCGTPTGTNQPSTDSTNGPGTTASGGATPGAGGSSTAATGGGGAGGGGAAGTPGAAAAGSAPGTVDPVTGAVTSGDAAAAAGSSEVYANPVELSSSRTSDNRVFEWVVALELLLVVLLPGLYVAYLRRRRSAL